LQKLDYSNGFHTLSKSHLGIGDLLVVLQGVPGGDLAILLAAGEQGALAQHDQAADALVVGLELRAYKVGAIRVHRVDGDEAVRVRCDDIAIRLELDTGDMGTRRLLHDVRALEEAILAPVPEGQVAASMGDD